MECQGQKMICCIRSKSERPAGLPSLPKVADEVCDTFSSFFILKRSDKMQKSSRVAPETVFAEFKAAREHKELIGEKGIYEQTRVNERFFVGDQWHGARCGTDRPLVRHNVIKRIGDYKMAAITANVVTVAFSADGVPNTIELTKTTDALRRKMAMGEPLNNLSHEEETALVMSALGDYYRVTEERLRYAKLRFDALRNAYVSGTGLIYTYWDSDCDTGLYADLERKCAIKGDIACEVLDVENVYFGDPSIEEVQNQPYIIISQRKRTEELKALAKRYGRPQSEIEAIGDSDSDGEKTTMLTKMWKEPNEQGEVTVKAVQVVGGATIRPVFDMKIRLYPIAKFNWQDRKNSAYGDSEITYLIPNQIAINRMLTANVWAVMMMGMPIMTVNGDIVNGPVTNDPGQIIKVFGSPEEARSAISYVSPPTFSPSFESNISSLISNTLTQAGANDAALGDISPNNTSAIIAVREAALMPLDMVRNRFYMFCEDVARIWAEFWVSMYGPRALKIVDENGTWYMPFDSDRYRKLIISTRVDVGAGTIWSESQSIKTLDNLLSRGAITLKQYLKRLPDGIITDVGGLIKELDGTPLEIERKKSEAEALIDGVESSVGDLTDSEIMAIKELSEGVKI